MSRQMQAKRAARECLCEMSPSKLRNDQAPDPSAAGDFALIWNDLSTA